MSSSPNGGSVSGRLFNYGLTTADAFPQAVVVPEGKILTLAGPLSGKKKTGYVTLIPKTIEDVKRWIGVPNEVAKRRSLPAALVSDLAIVDTPAAFAALSKVQQQSLQSLGYQYVYGDSSTLTQYGPTLSQLAVNQSIISIIGLFLAKDVDVLPNAELKLAANLKVFLADNVRIWKGGKIRFLGNLKFDCVTMVGEYVAPRLPTATDVGDLGVLTDFGG